MSTLNELIEQIENPELRKRIADEVNKLNRQKKFGLVFEEHLPECTVLYDIPIKKNGKVVRFNEKHEPDMKEIFIIAKIDGDNAICIKNGSTDTLTIPVSELVSIAEFGDPIYPYLKPIDKICNAPDSELWHTLIEADNYHALQLLEYLYAGKVDCIYIDPPYNKEDSKDWKYNCNYVDGNDQYRHSKWLSMIQKRLKIAKTLLNPNDSVLIVTIDETEYLHLGCLLEEMFPEAIIQMITDVINPRGTNRENEFSRVEEYIFVCRFGNASVNKSDNNMLGNTDETAKARAWFGFNRGNNLHATAPGQFYPIYINEQEKRIVEIGDPLPLGTPIEEYPKIDGLASVFPINDRGNESIWRAIPSTTREWVKKGYVKVSQFEKKTGRWTLAYIPSGLQARIESGEIKVNGKKADGSLDINQVDTSGKKVSPRSVWVQKYHNATDYGATIIKDIIPNHIFSYPKSLYAVHDTLWFFVANKKNAIIVDFFAGSGTTLHAVNLLNAEDGGQRRCILVTNNEMKKDEEDANLAKGLMRGSDEWNTLGIARYVTWPRTVCSIGGHDINGNPLKGNYIGSDLPMADGFKTNAAFFKLGFLDKTKISLGMQFKEMLPTLWMKVGAIGACPSLEDNLVPDMLILPHNRFAILNNENMFAAFKNELSNNPEIETVFLVTDYENSFSSMTNDLPGKTTYQLYRDYLDNFRINAGRDSR